MTLLDHPLVILVLFCLFLSGCTNTCWYHGKLVTTREAKEMKKLGMDVQCTDDLK